MTGKQGPVLDLWKAAVCKGDVPPLQGGEHMTVGQVRHPALASAFREEFRKWFFATKKQCKRWSSKRKLSDTAVPHLLNVVNDKLTVETTSNMTLMLAQALGWDKITCKQLKDMLESCAQPEQAMCVLLRNSRSHPATRAAKAAANKSTAAKTSQQKQARRKEDQTAAPTEALSDGVSSDADSDAEDQSGREDSVWDPEWAQQYSWLALPRDIAVQGVKVRKVPDSDPRVPLHGQYGIWAAHDMCEGFLLGPYRHYCLYSRTYEQILCNKPANWPGTDASWRLQCDSYACNDDSEATSTFHVSQSTDTYAVPGKYSLVFSGFGYGNDTAYANDPHLDPIKHLAMPDMPDDYLGPFITGADGQPLPSSVQIVYASICGWAYAFMTTVMPVSKGMELLYDYGHSYWAFAASGIAACEKDEKLQRQLKELTEQLRAATQVSSGLTISINATSSVHPGATQDNSAAAPAKAGRATTAAAGAVGGAAVPAGSVGGSSAPTRDARRRFPANLQSSGPGVSDMRQQLHGMQLAQDRDGSGGGVSESVAAGASVAQPQQQQQQQQTGRQVGTQQQQQGEAEGQADEGQADEGQAESEGEVAVSVGAGAATASGRISPAEEQDDASSAVPLSVLAYADLRLTPQQLEAIQRRQQGRQHVTRTRDEQGNLQEVRCIDSPDMFQMIKDVQMDLSRELLSYENGIKYKKLRGHWWDKCEGVKNYFFDKWDFITRHKQLFELSPDTFSPQTKVMLTEDWRKALIAQLRAEGRLPLEVLRREAAAAAGGLPQQQQYSSKKRKRGEVVLEKYIVDDAAEQKSRQLQKELQQKDAEMQGLQREVKKLRCDQEELNRGLQQAQQDVQVLVRLGQQAGVRIPAELLQRQQQRQAAGAAAGGGYGRGQAGSSRGQQQGPGQNCQHNQRPGTTPAAAAGMGPDLDPSLFDVESAPVFAALDSDSGTGSDISRSVSPQSQQGGFGGMGSESEEEEGGQGTGRIADHKFAQRQQQQRGRGFVGFAGGRSGAAANHSDCEYATVSGRDYSSGGGRGQGGYHQRGPSSEQHWQQQRQQQQQPHPQQRHWQQPQHSWQQAQQQDWQLGGQGRGHDSRQVGYGQNEREHNGGYHSRYDKSRPASRGG